MTNRLGVVFVMFIAIAAVTRAYAETDFCAGRSSVVRIPKGMSEKEVAAKVLKCYCPKPDPKLGSPATSALSPINAATIEMVEVKSLSKEVTAAVEQNLKSLIPQTMPEHETQTTAWMIKADKKNLIFVETDVSTPADQIPNYYCGFTLIVDQKISVVSRRTCDPQTMPNQQAVENYAPFDALDSFNGRPAIIAQRNASMGDTGGGDLVLFSDGRSGWGEINNGCVWGD